MEATLNLKPKKRDVWYKEPWLLLVAGGPAFVVVASIITGYIAIKGSDKVVADDYYKQGLMINKDIQRDAKAKELALSAGLSIDLKAAKFKDIWVTLFSLAQRAVSTIIRSFTPGSDSRSRCIRSKDKRFPTQGTK